MNCLEKIELARQELLEPPAPDAHPLEMMMQTVVHMIGPQVAQLMPEEPKVVDDFLEYLAAKILSFRSDDAEPLQLTDGHPPA